ncbi:hypothetical protein HPB52_015401 [Rhipicephalus sanguineus]|uniref:Uncharacterized protein n=1 Tax=Rhipicephalus sanguineus TaxID=34632 RepID=A0A9D4T132_RHISA|nr:hypothetical protein HPB52_015401 [Rhipicephalus sanguineus]
MVALIAYAATFALLALALLLHRRHGLAIYLPVFNFTTTDANVFNDSSLDQDVPGGCDEKEVSRVARLLVSSLNTTADPCKDFHSYVCSGFRRIVRTSLLDDMETQVTTSISRFFHRIASGVKKPLPEALTKAVEFYASCVKPVHTNGRTHALASFFKEQDFSFNTKIDGFLETTLELQLRLGLEIFFALVVDPYPRFQETSRYVYLGSSRLFEEWKRARNVLFMSGSYTSYASAVILATGFDENAAFDLARRVWYIESKLMTRSIKPKKILAKKKLESKWKELLHRYSRGALMGTYKLSLRSKPSAFFHQMMFKANDAEQSVDIVGAFYEGPNVLVIPAASMLSPLFNYGASPAINYGLLGSVIMQNLMRAFGHINMLTDGSGSPIAWIPEERADFEDRYQCDRMSEVRDSDVDPPAGVSVGAQAFFRAYKRASAARGNRSCALPGLERLSSDQVFFVSRCLLRCHDVPGTTDGVHLEDHTCNLMAKHSAEFANAFNCPMDHSNTLCDVW